MNESQLKRLFEAGAVEEPMHQAACAIEKLADAVSKTEAPIINVRSPDVNVAPAPAPVVNLTTEPKIEIKREFPVYEFEVVERDKNGLTKRIIARPMENA